MSSQSLNAVLPHLRRLLAGGADGPGDAQLLGEFLHRRDENAFATLVRRHGPMVLAVCRRLLVDPHDAEDAFQATFLVLVRKASTVGRPERLGNWLYGVAYRVALKMRGHNARCRLHEKPLVDVPAAGTESDLVWRELRPVLDEELHRLPEKYRVPVVLCYLEGISKRTAARQLGWPEGTLSTRLHQARLILRDRLSRRGLGLSAGLGVVLIQGTAPAAVPAILATATVAAASLVATGRAALVSASVAALVEGVVRDMGWIKLKLSVVLLAAVLVTMGLGGDARRTPAAPEGENKAPATPAAAKPKKTAAEPKTFPLGKNVKAAVWSPDGKLMASWASRVETKADGNKETRTWYSTVKVWDTVTGKEIASLGELRNSGLVALGFSPDGAMLALSFFSRIEEGARVELWDARKGELRKTIEMDYGRIVPKFAFAPDGKTLAVLFAGDKGRDKTKPGLNGGVRLFDPASGKEIRQIRGHKHMAISLAFAPDGRLLATGGSQHDNDIRLWDVASGKEQRVLSTDTIVPALVFSPDGKTLASGQGDGRVVLWDVASGKERRVLKDAPDYSYAVTFSPDGHLLAAVGTVEKDGKRPYAVRLWNAASGELLRSWDDTGASIHFTPDGKGLAILGRDGAVRLWELKGLVATASVGAGQVFDKLIDQLIESRKTDEQAAEWLYVAAMGRFPEERERSFLVRHLARKKDRREAMREVIWTILHSKDYLTHLDALKKNDPRNSLKKK
jgi:RNA polymerase sigma factor (sigma-70 family)